MHIPFRALVSRVLPLLIGTLLAVAITRSALSQELLVIG